MKPIEFRGRSREELCAFPGGACREAGYQLDRVQRGLDPYDWKPMPEVGAGVREIRIRQADGAFRILYVASIGKCIYVLRCFRKKTQRTAKSDIEMASKRYRELKEELE